MLQPYTSLNSNLFTKHAGTTLSIDLNAIIANYNYLIQKVKPAHCAAVIKADGYGLGMLPIAKALKKTSCKNFFVAYLDEGIALRSILNQDYNIFILNGLFPRDARPFIKHHLTPVLNDLNQIKIWVQICKEANINYPAAIQFDTGMSRLGLNENDLKILQQKALSPFNPVLIISHLACADEPKHPNNLLQLKKFKFFKKFFPSVTASLSASSGIFLGEAWHFDLTRPGAALYGLNPVPNQKNPMNPVVTLKSKILQIRVIPKNTPIGYGATYISHRPLKLAIIAIGYGDGFSRSLSNKAYVRHVHYPEIPLPIVGKISMDCLCIDISPLSDNTIQLQDEIEIIGPHSPIELIAQNANTIGYEILTSLGNRYHRIYI